MNIEVGQGFVFNFGNKFNFQYGLIIGKHDGQVDYVYVRPAYEVIDDRIKRFVCYDEPDAVEQRDKDHVRLESCPPPFSKFGSYSIKTGEKVSNVVAFADMTRVRSMSLSMFMHSENIRVIDGGTKVSETDMDKVYSHPWGSRNQRERILADISELNRDDDKTRSVSNKYDRLRSYGDDLLKRSGVDLVEDEIEY